LLNALDIHPLCKLTLDLSGFSFTSFPAYENAVGGKYRRVECTLRMAVTVSSVDWEVWCQEKRVKVNVEYGDDETAHMAKIPT